MYFRTKWLIAHLIRNDELYIKIEYFRIFHRKINLRNPQSFNEKLNWLKLYDRNPLYSTLADKYKVKEYVARIIGDQYVVPNYGVWDSYNEIDFSKLPEQFVLKATHDSGGAFICKNKSTFDYKGIGEKLTANLNRNYFWVTREWVYKNSNPRIIADMFLDDGTDHELTDYKFWCFSGEPKIMYITNKGEKIYENFYDTEFNPIYINHGFPRREHEYSKPLEFELMLQLAAKLSVGIPFVRVDFFDIRGRVYFGEFTFYDWAGLQPFKDYETDIKLGDYIVLPTKEHD